jgi:hypothetical protein
MRIDCGLFIISLCSDSVQALKKKPETRKSFILLF